jgi:hypothetical protein
VLATALPDLVDLIAQACWLAISETSGSMYTPYSYYGGGFNLGDLYDYTMNRGLIGIFARMFIGAYLFFGGGLIVAYCIPSNRPYCPQCGYELRSARGQRCPECGSFLPEELIESRAWTVEDDDAPPTKDTGTVRTGLTRFVPRSNRAALLAYYCAVASVIPGLGLVVGPAAVVYGIEGLRHLSEHPDAGGRAHAWVGIVFGVVLAGLNACGTCVGPAMLFAPY